mmetsp:Transcript_30242/g.29564  ORF Transcript_30242/g.29564 Transcript_30242/m.29564 type:complete len:173 (+) Transcript_30242:3540-4058(+)
MGSVLVSGLRFQRSRRLQCRQRQRPLRTCPRRPAPSPSPSNSPATTAAARCSTTDEEKEQPIIIIDTEGLGAFDEDDNHDTKIFLLALLLCSLLVYNSVGSIDENVLNSLSLVVNLSKSLQIRNDQKLEEPDELAEYFPTFFWILRDFALKLVDNDGNLMTSKQYLESALKE